MRRSDVGFADLARAVSTLEPTPVELERIASLLGFRRAASDERTTSGHEGPTKPNATPPETFVPKLESPRPPPAPSQRGALSSEVAALPADVPLMPFVPVTRLDTPRPAQGEALEPLFRSGWQRAILTALAATRWPSGDIDADALITRSASGAPIRALPRELRHTLARGVHLLVDNSASMLPFARDCRELAKLLRTIAGTDLNLGYFDGTPARGIRNSGSGDRYQSHYGVTVVVVSDFGLGPRAPGERYLNLRPWLAFLDGLSSSSCSVAALVPGVPRRLPRALRQRLAVVGWERATTTSRVRAERRRTQVRGPLWR